MREIPLSRQWSNLGIIFLLTPEEDLKILSPDGILTPPLLDELRTHKLEILQSLREKYFGIPISWSNAIEITLTRNTPRNISESRWRAIIQRLDVLIHREKPHLLKMIEYGWSTEEIFGCHKFAPDIRIDSMGLLMLMTNATIAEIKPTVAFLKHKDEAISTYSLGMLNRNRQEQSILMEIE
jgi:hypothetical protein